MSQVAKTDDGFAALNSLGAGLAQVNAASLNGAREQLAEKLLRSAMISWEDPEVRPKILATLTAAVTSKEGAERLREFLYSQLFAQVGIALNGKPMDIEQVAETLGVPAININAAAAQVWGMALYRYVLGMEPMASASPEELIDLLSPTIQRYLVG